MIKEFEKKLDGYRNELIEIDNQLINLLNERAMISSEIGILKIKNNIELYQSEYWQKAQKIRSVAIASTCLNGNITNEIFEVIHQQSLLIQEEILKQKNEQ